MITGLLYVALLDGAWLTLDCARLKADPNDASQSFVLVFEYPDVERERGPVDPYIVRALDSATPPVSGTNIYVAN